MGGWKLGYGLNFQLSKYKNSTLGILEQFDYESKIDFVKYGFFGKISRSFLNDNLNLFFGIRTDKDSFLSKSNLINNLSPRMGFSYSITKSDAWKLNGSIGWYNKLPPYTMIGFKDINNILIEAEKLNCKIITTEKDYFRLKNKNFKIQFIKVELQILDEDKLIKTITE